MKSKEYLKTLISMSPQELSNEFYGLLRQRAGFCFTKKDPQTKALPHQIRVVRRNIARLKMIMTQRQKGR
ncbi:50S ribosomal protein L29 [Holospora curviuscula]|uniref:Large ribosomal subunit protein uL29 n=1 Tax=Holospora curviuscula TaxID=1082868 RepID=A0A2S5R8J0_9PROT|nr:50S ribosomal protein L29 [Holospora curviuscula]PPE03651.1 50S ribosomal protein L29 [Holospora curviuscula]